MFKYLLKNFCKEPFFNQNLDRSVKSTLPMTVYCSRLIEVPINQASPRPYILHEAKKIEDLPVKEFELSINI